LGPALRDARETKVSLTICNEIIDGRKVNPPRRSVGIRVGLRQAGVKDPDVAIERIDCGPAGPGTSRMTSPTVTRRDSRVFATVPIMQAVRIL